MTQRMERLGNEVNSFRDEMMTIFIISMNTAREAEARADTAAAAAKEANVCCAETEISMAKVEHEIGQETTLRSLAFRTIRLRTCCKSFKLWSIMFSCSVC